MKKILIGYLIDGHSGGIDKYLMNLMESIPFDNNAVQIDFLTNRITEELQRAVAKYHSHIYEVETLKHPIRQYKQMVSVFKDNAYDVAYFNISTALNCIGVAAAKKCGIKKRIIHSHACGIDENNRLKRTALSFLNHLIAKTFLYRQGTDFCACSELAGLWLFPEKIVRSSRFQVIKNAVDTKAYVYSPTKRETVRKALGLEDKLVIGHVGLFGYAKNHAFLLKVFQQVYAHNAKAVLLLVGDGVLYSEIVRQVNALGLQEAVLFLGQRRDVPDLLQAMDIFVLPSNFEGFGIVGIEAQVSGLNCIFSNHVPNEVAFTDNCVFLEIDQENSASEWAKQIEKMGHKSIRQDACALAEKAGYSLKKQSVSFLLGEEG